MNYPRVACYAANRGSGAPLLKPDASGEMVPDLGLLQKLARYPTITLPLTPWYSTEGVGSTGPVLSRFSRADVPLLLRRYNPAIRIFGYQLLGWWYLPPNFVPRADDLTFNASWHNALRRTEAFGAQSGSGWWVRWENPATEAALSKLLCNAAGSRLFDGLFFDFASATSGSGIAAMQRSVAAIRNAGVDVIIGNGYHADSLDLEGSFREGFPSLLGHDFARIRDWRAGRPHKREDWLQAGTGYTSLDTEDAKRAARFALGTACLFDAPCSFGPDRDLSVQPYYGTWWLPEYDGGGIGTGWLGVPMKSAAERAGGWERYFAGGMMLVNPGASPVTISLPRGLYAIGGPEMGTVMVAAQDAVFLIRS